MGELNQYLEMINREEPCHRCGGPGKYVHGPMMHGGTYWCDRCVTEVNLFHAREQAARIPELEARLVELGGPAKRIICGYVNWKNEDDPTAWGALCILDRGHEGDHSPSGKNPAGPG